MLSGNSGAEQIPSADPDADGTTNLNEFVGGTDPARADAISLLSAGPVTADTFTVFLRRVVHLPLTVELLTSANFADQGAVATAEPELLTNPALEPGVGLFQINLPGAPTRQFVRMRITVP